MRPPPPPPPAAPLTDPWFKGDKVFSVSAPGETELLDLADLIPAENTRTGASVTYARDGAAISLRGAALLFEHTDELSLVCANTVVTRTAIPPRVVLREMARQGEAELRRAPAILGGIGRDLRQLMADGKMPLSAFAGAFAAGVFATLMVGWMF
jgi:hypothetical protein